MSGLSTFHGEDQACRDIAHVDEIDDKIEIKLETLAEKVPQHGHRRGKIVVIGPDRHRGTADDHRKTGCRGLHRDLIGKHFRARIGTRHVVGRQQRIIRNAPRDGDPWKRMDSVEQCRNRATPRFARPQ